MILTDKDTLKLMQEFADQQTASLKSENKELRKVLKELVELKYMKGRMENDFAALHQSEYDKMKEDYETRKPLAWEAARKVSETDVNDTNVVDMREQIFDKMARAGMDSYELSGFKRTHPTLFKVIMSSMQIYADQENKQSHDALQQAYERALPTSMKIVECPSCQEKIRVIFP